MSSAFESDASFPVLVVAEDAGSMCAIVVGVSSRRNRPKNPPPFFFSASGAAGCGGGAHSSVREGVARVGGDSGSGRATGALHGSAALGASFGGPPGAHAL